MTWLAILTQWDAIEADLQDAGIDVESGVLAHRSARWLQVKIRGLLMSDSRLARAIQSEKGG